MRVFLGILLTLIAACSRNEAPSTPVIFYQDNPEKLSEWRLFDANDTRLRLSSDVYAYDLSTPLFSDYAQKLRTIHLPADTIIEMDDQGAFAFPVGTILTKTFYYASAGEKLSALPVIEAVGGILPTSDAKLIETRLLVKRSDGWIGLPYIWNEDGTEAYLARAGGVTRLDFRGSDGESLDFDYFIPDQNQCASCHATDNTARTLEPLGFNPRHLARPAPANADVDQLDWLRHNHILDFSNQQRRAIVANADWTDETQSLEARARAYLDINCSACHNRVGPADTSGLSLEPTASGAALGICKRPIAAGRGAGDRPFDIKPGAPEESILLYRMETTDPSAMMPELGRALAHKEGVALIRDWIASLEGDCV